MDGLTIQSALVIGAVLLIVFLWVIWKFFTKLFKHVIIMLIIGAAGATFYYCNSLPPPPPAYVGKHAYMDGVYIGVVESQAEDRQRGPVWIIRPIGGGPPMKYSQKRVTLRDKMEIKPGQAPGQAPAPAPESKPASDKVDKKTEKTKS